MVLQRTLQIESLAARAHDVLRLSRWFRNLSQSVNRLPPEVLSRIIRYIPREGDTDARSIVALTHVCQYWRELITSTPQNWTLISSRSMGLATLSLRYAEATHSPALELRLRIDQLGRKSKFPKLINSQTQKIKTLHFVGLSRIEDLTQTLPNFPQSAPNLLSLTLGGSIDADMKSRSVDPFESLTPNLRRLGLAGIPLYPSLLRLRALTELDLYDHRFNLPLDTLLDFLEENRSLKSTTLNIRFKDYSLENSRREVAITDRLRYLSIDGVGNSFVAKALISKFALRRGAHLKILSSHETWPDEILSGIPVTQFSNLSSPTFMEYVRRRKDDSIRLLGPNGSFSFQKYHNVNENYEEFPEGLRSLPLTDIRELRLVRSGPGPEIPLGALDPPYFPAIETFVVVRSTRVLRLLSNLFSNPSSHPSLKTLAFLDCDFSEDFMEKLTRFSSNRKNTTSAWLRRVVIVDSQGNIPSVGSVEGLRKYVPIVDVCMGKELPADLT